MDNQCRDFSNSKKAKEILDNLGGELLLKSDYPRVYAAYLDTVVKHTRDLQAHVVSNTPTPLERLISGAKIEEPMSDEVCHLVEEFGKLMYFLNIRRNRY